MDYIRNLRNIRAVYFFFFAGFAIISVFINVYYREFGLSGTQIGWINSLAPLVGILGGPVWAWIGDRTGRPRLMMAAAVIGSMLAVLGISSARGLAALIALSAMWNLFNSILFPSIDSINLAALGDQTENYGKQRIWGTLGYVTISISAGFVLAITGLNRMFMFYIVLMLVMLGFVPLLPALPKPKEVSSQGSLRGFVTQRRLILFIASAIPLWVAWNGLNAFLNVYLKDMGATSATIGLVSAVTAMAEMPAMYFGSILLRRLGFKRMLVVSYACYALRMFFYSLIPSPIWAVLVGGLMHGLTFGLFWIAGIYYINELSPPSFKATSQTIYFSAMTLAGVIGAPFGGYVMDQYGGAMLFRLYSVLCVIALGILLAGFKASSRELENLTA